MRWCALAVGSCCLGVTKAVTGTGVDRNTRVVERECRVVVAAIDLRAIDLCLGGVSHGACGRFPLPGIGVITDGAVARTVGAITPPDGFVIGFSGFSRVAQFVNGIWVCDAI